MSLKTTTLPCTMVTADARVALQDAVADVQLRVTPAGMVIQFAGVVGVPEQTSVRACRCRDTCLSAYAIEVVPAAQLHRHLSVPLGLNVWVMIALPSGFARTIWNSSITPADSPSLATCVTQLAAIKAVGLQVFDVWTHGPHTADPVGPGHVAVRCSVIEPDSHALQACVLVSGGGTTQFCTQVLDEVVHGPVAVQADQVLHGSQLYAPVGAGQYALRVCDLCCG